MLINNRHLFTANGFHNIHTKILAWCFCEADAAVVCKLSPNTSPGAGFKDGLSHYFIDTNVKHL